MASAVISPTAELSVNGIEPLLTLEEAARILGRSHWTLRMDHKAGRIKCVKIGRNLMVERNEVRRIIQDGLPPN
jgi:hypothetical protein